MPRIVDRERERARLAAAARELFARHGFGRVTMREAAGALGVSTGTLYHYFADKADLFTAVVRHVVETEVVEVGTGLRAVPVALRLAALFEAARHNLPHAICNYRVLIDAIATSPGTFDAAIAHARARYLAAVMEVLELDATRADLVLLSLSGLVLRGLCGDTTSTDLDALRDLLTRRLLPETD